MRLLSLLIAIAAATAAVAQTPADWKIVKDAKQRCQMAMPPGWTEVMPGHLSSADNKWIATFAGKPLSEHYADYTKHVNRGDSPDTVIEKSGRRLWFSSTSPGKVITAWLVTTNTTPVCQANIGIPHRAFEATARIMVNSLKQVD